MKVFESLKSLKSLRIQGIDVGTGALGKLKKILVENPRSVLRVTIGGFSCSGPSLELALGMPGEGDRVEVVDGLELHVDARVHVLMAGCRIHIDYNAQYKGFVLEAIGTVPGC